MIGTILLASESEWVDQVVWTRNAASFVRSESYHIGLVAGVRAKVHQGPMYCSGRGPA